MSLVKKTVVLSGKSPLGYATFVRVGKENGVKIVGENLLSGQKAYLKIGREWTIITLDGKRTEREIPLTVTPTDNVSVVVYDNKEIILYGGKPITEREKTALFAKNITAEIAENTETAENTEIAENTETAENTEIAENNETAENTEIAENSETAENVENGENNENVENDENNEKEKIELDKIEEMQKAEENKEVAESTQNAEENKDIAESTQNVEENEMLRLLSEERKDFYLSISEKIEELFVVYPQENALSNAFPDSEWVKVSYDGDDYYVVGKIYDDKKVAYLGYGVPGKENVKPPKIADEIAQWFPLKIENYDGYWLFFQDADTGKIDRN